ncbi:hypothetical protein GIB67_013339 [Kingdonia uniflora]|uniref:Bulb-type lectin domain-containing protein n=1 Tax=Kingdonia uniflora TaxID=39325 RepID=A0A7J7LR16_9MAGN|nr:hypothetical protein GIB67_013339 [Kingdonia uniflora]
MFCFYTNRDEVKRLTAENPNMRPTEALAIIAKSYMLHKYGERSNHSKEKVVKNAAGTAGEMKGQGLNTLQMKGCTHGSRISSTVKSNVIILDDSDDEMPLKGIGVLFKCHNRSVMFIQCGQKRHIEFRLGIYMLSENLVAELFDSENLVLKDGNSVSYLWQSFDYPSDTLLLGMKLGWDLKRGPGRYLSAWKNYDDRSVGDLTYRLINIHGYPEAFDEGIGGVLQDQTMEWDRV